MQHIVDATADFALDQDEFARNPFPWKSKLLECTWVIAKRNVRTETRFAVKRRDSLSREEP